MQPLVPVRGPFLFPLRLRPWTDHCPGHLTSARPFSELAGSRQSGAVRRGGAFQHGGPPAATGADDVRVVGQRLADEPEGRPALEPEGGPTLGLILVGRCVG